MLSFGIMVYNSAKETVESSNTTDSDNSINNSILYIYRFIYGK